MTTFPNSPRLLKGGLVLIEPLTGQVVRIVPLQYNPDSLRRTLQVQSARGEGGDQLAALETIVYPSSLQLIANQLLALAGTIEIAPAEAPLTLFIWSAARILPV